jgi:hypothetical protein
MTAIVILCSASALALAPLFDHSLSYWSYDGPYSVCCGDLDNDNDLDLAVANMASDNGSVLLGNGDGTLSQASGNTSASVHPPVTLLVGPLRIAKRDSIQHAGVSKTYNSHGKLTNIVDEEQNVTLYEYYETLDGVTSLDSTTSRTGGAYLARRISDTEYPAWLGARSDSVFHDLDIGAAGSQSGQNPQTTTIKGEMEYDKRGNATKRIDDRGVVNEYGRKITDGTDTATALVRFDFTPVKNGFPVAVDDDYGATEDVTLVIDAAGGVLANDRDIGGDVLTAVLESDVSNGVLNLNADGSFDYTPNTDFSGVDIFTYRADDGLLTSAVATVTINVKSALDPDAVVILPLDEGSGTVAGDVSGMGNDGTLINGSLFEATTADGSASAVRFDGTDDLIDLGVLDVNGTGLTLAARFNGVTFPGPSKDPRLISKASDVFADDHVFMLSTIESGTAVRLRGRVRVGGVTRTLIATSGDIQVGQWYHAAFTYDGTTMRLYLDGVEVGSTPLSGAVDMDPTMAVAVGGQPVGAGARCFDGLLDDVRILQRALDVNELLSIVGGNKIPVVLDDGPYTVPEGGTHTEAAPGLLANDSDADGGPLSVNTTPVTPPVNGTVTLSAGGGFVYTHDGSETSADSLEYEITDERATATAWVRFDITPVNDAPVAQDDDYQAEQDKPLVVAAAAGVLANDTDEDLDTLEAVLESDVSNGVLNLNADGSFDYTPNNGFNGTDGFTYRARDAGMLTSDLANVEISVQADGSNDPPRIVSGTIAFVKQVVHDQATRTHAVVAADLDADGDLDMAGTSETDGMVYWYENDGNGGFVTHVVDADLVGAYPLHQGDVDLDGDPDLLSCGYYADEIVWYENDGSAQFTRHVVDATADGPHSVVTGDMDNDGDIDLVATHQDYGNAVVWYENDGNEGFILHMIDDDATGAKRAEYADIDGDGDMDVVAGSFYAQEVVWYENDGSENFTKRIIDQPANGTYFVFPVDIDDDDDLDVLGAINLENQVALYINDGSGNFTAQIIDDGAYHVRSVAAADVDGDGDLDPLSANHDENLVAWYENDGAGGFTKRVVDYDAYAPYGVTPIDIDFDGDVDVLTAIKLDNTIAVNYQIRSHLASLATAGGTLVIDAAHLLTADTDDGPAGLTYTLTDAPDWGEIRKNGVMVPEGGTFTQQDINNSLVTYVHDGSASCSDRFDFSVADGGEDGVMPAAGTFAINLPAVIFGHWPLDEGSGIVAGDVSGMGNDGTLVNGAVFEATTGDGSASAVRFDGVDDRIDLGFLDVNGPGFTLAAWFNAVTFPGTSNDPRLISKASSASENDHVFMLGMFRWLRETEWSPPEVRLRGRVRIGGVTTTVIAPMGNLDTGTWYHAALTYDGATLRLYLDGVQVGGATGLSGPVDTAPTMAVAIGGQPPGAGDRFFDGLIDDVRIVQRALTAEELLAIVGTPGVAVVAKDILATSGPNELQPVLYQNRPNPFNPTTVISYELADAGDVELRVYNVRGALVKVLESAYRPAGRHDITWDATNDRGERVASGVYFYQLQTAAFSRTRKMVFLR